MATKTATLELLGGESLWNVLHSAVERAATGVRVVFDFNGIKHSVKPRQSFDAAKADAEERCGFPILSPDEVSAKASADLKEMAESSAKAIADAKVPTESEMRDADVPWLKSPEELTAYIAALVDRPHDYGTCVYAMSMAAVAAYYHAATVLGVMGFQASCADLDILRRTRRIDGPFLILQAEDFLYPQYDLHGKVDDLREKSREWLREQATKNLADTRNARAHPNVVARWRELADVK